MSKKFDPDKAKAKPKKGDSVKYGPFKKAKVVEESTGKHGYMEIETPNGTRFVVDPSGVVKND